MGNELNISLKINSDGSATIQQVTGGLKDLRQETGNAGAGMDSLGRSSTGAGTALSMAAGHASSLIIQLAAIAGVSLTVAAALEGVAKSIEAISNTSLSSIASAAMMLSRENIDGIEAQQAAYSQYKTYVLSMYKDLYAETERHFASGMEMVDTFNAFAQRGIYASRDEASAIGVVADAVKLLHHGYIDQATVMHEIQGLMEGHAGIRFKLAQQLSTIIGPEWKEVIRSEIEAGTLLTFLEEKYKGLGVASQDIQKTLTAQKTTLDTLMIQIGKGGLQGLYEDIVGLVIDINDHLRAHKDDYIVAIAKGWATIKWTIEGAAKAAKDIQEATKIPEKSPATGFMDVAQNNLAKAMGASPNVIFTEPLRQASDFIAGMSSGLQSWGQAGDAVLKKWSDSCNTVLGYLKTFDEWFAKNYSWMVDFETPKRELEDIKSKLTSLVDYFSKPVTWVINVVVSGLPSWMTSGGPAAPVVSSGGPVTSPDLSMGARLAEAQAQGRRKALDLYQYQRPSGELNEVPGWVLPWAPSTSAPPDRPAMSAEKGSKSTEAEASRLAALFDTLTKDIARLSEGKFSEVEANYDKTMEQIYKKQRVRVTDEEELAVLAKKRENLQKEKLTDDFYQAMAKEAGDAYMTIDLWQEKSLKDWKGVKDKITGQPIDVSAWVSQATDKKYYEQSLKDWEKMTSLQEKYLTGMAAAAPFLSQQLALEREVLPFQEALAQSKLEDLIYHEKLNDEWRVSRGLAALMTPEMEGQLRYLEAQTEELKRQAQKRKEWETQGVGGGLQMWSFERQQEMEKRGATQTVEFMKSSEAWMGDAFGNALVDKLHGKKPDLMKIFSDLGDSLIKRGAKELVGFGFDAIAKGIGIPGLGGKPDGSIARPFHVIPQGAAGLGGSKGKSALSGEDRTNESYNSNYGGGSEYGDVPDVQQWDDVAQKWSDVGDQNAGAGDLLSASGVSGIAAGASLGLGAIGMITGSQTLMMAATAIGMAASLLQIAAAMGILPFHSGGVVAHHGWLVAHDGLALDERRVIAQVGEGIIRRSAMAEYAHQGVTFDMLNSGRLPVAPLPVPVAAGGDRRGGGDLHYHDNSTINLPPGAKVQDFQTALKEHRKIVVEIIKEAHRNFALTW